MRTGPQAAEQLVVRYDRVGAAHAVRYFLVPVDGSGSPVEALLYRGDARSIGEIRDELAAMAHSDIRADQLLKPLKRFDRENARGFHKFEWAGYGPDNRAQRLGSESSKDKFVFGFRRGVDKSIIVVPGEVTETPDLTFKQVWPRDCEFVVLPMFVARPGGEVVGARIGAVLLTPLTVAGDVALFPLVLVLVLTGSGC